MPEIRLFHGTDMESAKLILKNGFKNGFNVWDVSNPLAIYLIDEQYDNHDDARNIPSEQLPAFRFATEAAQLAAASKNSKEEMVAVFEFTIDENLMSEFHRDYTNERDLEHSWECETKIINTLIHNGKMKTRLFTINHAYEPGCRYLYLAYTHPDYFSMGTEKEQDILETIRQEAKTLTLHPPELTEKYMQIRTVSVQTDNWPIEQENNRNLL